MSLQPALTSPRFLVHKPTRSPIKIPSPEGCNGGGAPGLACGRAEAGAQALPGCPWHSTPELSHVSPFLGGFPFQKDGAFSFLMPEATGLGTGACASWQLTPNPTPTPTKSLTHPEPTLKQPYIHPNESKSNPQTPKRTLTRPKLQQAQLKWKATRASTHTSQADYLKKGDLEQIGQLGFVLPLWMD